MTSKPQKISLKIGRITKAVSKTTGKIKTLWRRLADREYRDAYVANRVANDVAFQVYYLRESRGWTQGQLAEEAGTKQPAISRLERSIGSVNVGTLLKVAAAFGIGLQIQFVPFSKLVRRTDQLDADIPDYDRDSPAIGSTEGESAAPQEDAQ